MFNAEKYISRCLKSILDQDIAKKEYEIIVINDGSQDKSLSIAKSFQQYNSNIKIYSIKNNGISFARNLGIQNAIGKYLIFIDSDDYITSNSLKILIEVASKNDLDILGFKFLRTKSLHLNLANKLTEEEKKIKILNGESYLINKYYYRESACWYLIKKDYLSKLNISFIVGRFLEDTIFTAEAFLKANRVAFLPLEVYRYVINPNSVWTNKSFQHTRKKIDDFTYITIKYNELIHNLTNLKLKKRLEHYRDQMTLNILKRIFESDLKIPEVIKKINLLEKENLYPLHLKSSRINKVTNLKPLLILWLFQNKKRYLMVLKRERFILKLIHSHKHG